MRSGYASLAVVGVAAGVALFAAFNYQFAAPSTSLYASFGSDDLEFLKFVSQHGKSYATKEEFAQRTAIFKSNLAAIRAENAKPENTFRLTVNKFADWSASDFKRILNPQKAARRNPALGSSSDAGSKGPVKDIPAAIDWRNYNSKSYVNPIKD